MQPDPNQTTDMKLSVAQAAWLRTLARMSAPLVCPGPEIASYKALARRGLAERENVIRPGEPAPGWVITDDGRRWVEAHK